MTYSISYNAEDHVIVCEFQGELTIQTARDYFSEMVILAKEKNCERILVDLRRSNLNIPIIDLYQLPTVAQSVQKKLDAEDLVLKRAVVINNDFGDHYFYETVSQNRGFRVKMFLETQEAREWLLAR